MLFFDGYGNTLHVAIIQGGLPVNKSKALFSSMCYTGVLCQRYDSGLTAKWEVGTFCT